MPSSEVILASLSKAVNTYYYISFIWHIIFFAVIIMLIKGWRPSKKIFSMFLAMPFISVSVVSALSLNPFNFLVFLMLSVSLVITGLKLPDEKIEIKRNFFISSGILIIAFGLLYPHFLDKNFLFYFLMAPTGIIPCPTLSVIIGFTLLLNGFNSKIWTIILTVMGLFYGITGIVNLKVYLDAGLLIGASICLVLSFTLKKNVKNTK